MLVYAVASLLLLVPEMKGSLITSSERRTLEAQMKRSLNENTLGEVVNISGAKDEIREYLNKYHPEYTFIILAKHNEAEHEEGENVLYAQSDYGYMVLIWRLKPKPNQGSIQQQFEHAVLSALKENTNAYRDNVAADAANRGYIDEKGNTVNPIGVVCSHGVNGMKPNGVSYDADGLTVFKLYYSHEDVVCFMFMPATELNKRGISC